VVFELKRPMEDLGADGRIIFKMELKEMGCWDVEWFQPVKV
jgi:hypothetical protein